MYHSYMVVCPLLYYCHRSALEEQQSALERDYKERIRVIREELERKKEEEKAQMKQELEEVQTPSLRLQENKTVTVTTMIWVAVEWIVVHTMSCEVWTYTNVPTTICH